VRSSSRPSSILFGKYLNRPLNPVDVWGDLAFDAVDIGAEIIEIAKIPSTIPSNSSPASSPPAQTIPVEDQFIALPSNGNTSAIHWDLELAHRVSIAEDRLNHIHNLIAEKSFSCY
jgi:hypothetical protein